MPGQLAREPSTFLEENKRAVAGESFQALADRELCYMVTFLGICPPAASAPLPRTTHRGSHVPWVSLPVGVAGLSDFGDTDV